MGFFIPKHRIVHSHVRVVILKLQLEIWRDVINMCVTSAIVQ